MQPIQQADRQWLAHLYSQSPSSGLDFWLFRIGHRFTKVLRLFQKALPKTQTAGDVTITSHYDAYDNVIWHAYNPALGLSFSTYSWQELQDWISMHTSFQDGHFNLGKPQ